MVNTHAALLIDEVPAEDEDLDNSWPHQLENKNDLCETKIVIRVWVTIQVCCGDECWGVYGRHWRVGVSIFYTTEILFCTSQLYCSASVSADKVSL